MTMDLKPFGLKEKRDQRPLLGGAIGGFIAGAPMGMFMLAVHSFLPKWQQYPLPPLLIVKSLASRVGLKKEMTGQQERISTVVAHFIYSGFVGIFYRPLTKKIALPTLIRGTIFGVLIWGISYLVLVPLLNIPRSSSAQEQPLQRNLMMIVAHIIWGVITGEIEEHLFTS